MGIWSRFRQLMKANISARLERAGHSERAIDTYLRELERDFGQVKAEAASIEANERRAKRALDECAAEVRRLQRYAEKAVEEGDDDKALRWLERKAEQEEKRRKLQVDYENARTNAAKIKALQDKIASDLHKLETRLAELKAKSAEARLGGGKASAAQSAFRELEDKANLALYEAEALAELRSGVEDDEIDRLIEQLEAGSSAEGLPSAQGAGSAEGASSTNGTASALDPEAELAAIKAKLVRD